MSSPREEATAPRHLSRPVAWNPPAVVACSLPSGHPSSGMEARAPCGLARCGPKISMRGVVSTLVPNLLLLGLPLVRGEENLALRRENA